MYIAQGWGRQPIGDKVLMSTETSCHFIHWFKFKRNVFEVWFYTILFHDLIHIYSPRVRADSPRGQKFDVNRKASSLYPFVASFKSKLFEVWFNTFFFHEFIHVYSPGAGGIQPPGNKVLMSTETSCHFGHLLLFQIIDDNSFWKIHCFTFFPI